MGNDNSHEFPPPYCPSQPENPDKPKNYPPKESIFYYKFFNY